MTRLANVRVNREIMAAAKAAGLERVRAASDAAFLVPILCLTPHHGALAPVGSRLSAVGAACAGLRSADDNYINRVADGLGVDLEPEMRDFWRSE